MSAPNDYDVFTGSSALSLAHNVRAAMARGWKPVGGVAVAGSDANGWEYAQAMVLTVPGGRNGP